MLKTKLGKGSFTRKYVLTFPCQPAQTYLSQHALFGGISRVALKDTSGANTQDYTEEGKGFTGLV